MEKIVNMGKLRQIQNKAEKYYTDALQLAIKCFYAEDPNTLKVVLNYSIFLIENDKSEHAEKLLSSHLDNVEPIIAYLPEPARMNVIPLIKLMQENYDAFF